MPQAGARSYKDTRSIAIKSARSKSASVSE